MDAVVTLDQLKAITGYTNPGSVEACLRKNGVRFLYGRHGDYTTIDALNAAMGIGKDTLQPVTQPEIDML